MEETWSVKCLTLFESQFGIINNKWLFSITIYTSTVYSFMCGIKIESFTGFIFVWKTSIHIWLYLFAIYVLEWCTKEDYSSYLWSEWFDKVCCKGIQWMSPKVVVPQNQCVPCSDLALFVLSHCSANNSVPLCHDSLPKTSFCHLWGESTIDWSGRFPPQKGLVMESFDIFFIVCLSKLFNNSWVADDFRWHFFM